MLAHLLCNSCFAYRKAVQKADNKMSIQNLTILYSIRFFSNSCFILNSSEFGSAISAL